jgi:hypothetical protein
MKRVILDLDDFCEEQHSLDLLFRLRGEIPGFRATLFTIPKRSGLGFVKGIQELDWLDLVPHGYLHATSRECEHWTYEYSLQYLDWVEHFGFTKGFKAPGWQISDGMYQALAERGYWVADQAYNDARRPPQLPAYTLAPEQVALEGEEVIKIHGHIGHLGGTNENELSRIFAQIIAHRSGCFEFIRDYVSPLCAEVQR